MSTAPPSAPGSRAAPPDVLGPLFEQAFGVAPVARQALPEEGSRRRMVRLLAADGRRAIGVLGPDRLENRAFLSFSGSFARLGLPVPQVLAAAADEQAYLVEDLGDVTLYDHLATERTRTGDAWPAGVHRLYEQVLATLVRFQVDGGRAVDFERAYPRTTYDERAILTDLHAFRFHFLRLARIEFHEGRLERDFERLAARLGRARPEHFLYRDLQSRNVMVRDGAPWFLDYQGGMRGAPQYDVAKLLYEGKAAIPPAARAGLLDGYLARLGERVAVDRGAFLALFPGFVWMRILQGLAAYGFLGLFERKPDFLRRIPPAVREIRARLAEDDSLADFPVLREVLERIAVHPGWDAPAAPAPGALCVRVGSFSYRRGIPADEAGHGGGFVFDCRALPNPGRVGAFALRTGADADVARFLEEHPECERFFQAAAALVEQQIAVYRARGFDALQVLFGCTGGQHRSVYFAERLARALGEAAEPARVELTHHERPHWPGGPG